LDGGYLLNLSVAIALFAALVPANAALLSVRVEDERHGPVPARVYLVDERGQPVFPPNTIRYEKVRPDGISERHFVPAAGSFTVDLKAGTYQLTVERGKEYLPQTVSLTVPGSGELERTVQLHRWVDMSGRGWFSADMHVHRALSELPVLMQAEDLSVVIPISSWKTKQLKQHDPDLDRFLASSDRDGVYHAPGGRLFPVLNEELEPRASALLASWLGRNPVPLLYPLERFGKAVEGAGGLSDSEKATSLELPALAALNAFETVGLVNNHIWRSHSFADPWGAWPDRMLHQYPHSCRGFVQSGFDMYSALLNVGFPVKLSAGSASGVHPVPPGWSRIYVHTGHPLAARDWFEGVRKGRSFVTTGPMLFLLVNGKEPGDDLRNLKFPAPLTIGVEMLSTHRVSQVEVVVNGAVHPVNLSPDSKNSESYYGSLQLTAVTSSWIVGRWVADREHTCDAAHTSPVYVWNGNRPVPVSITDARMLFDRVTSLIGDVTSGRDLKDTIMLDSDELRTATLEQLQQAQEVYRRKMSDQQ
jgi:hypothetical protein